MSRDRAEAQKSRSAAVKLLLLLFYCSSALFLGCGGPSGPTLPAVHAKAITYNQKGTKAAENGDYGNALRYYTEALKINSSIENTEGMAVNLINMAVIYYKQDNISSAQEFIDTALSIPGLNDATISEAAFEKARLCLKVNDLSRAKEWVNKSLSLNKGLREGSRWNLLGRIAFREGRYDEALTLANRGFNLNRENRQIAEEASSLMLLAEINAQKGNYSKSEEFYIEALQIEKELGDNRKISASLRGLGDIYLKQAKLQDAINFYMRAYNVSKTAGDTKSSLLSVGSLIEMYRKSGDENKAEEFSKKKNELTNKISAEAEKK